MVLDRQTQIDLYTTMHTIRRFEERVAFELSTPGQLLRLRASVHRRGGGGDGRVRPCDDDYIISTHRGHGHCIAKGADMNRMMAELYGSDRLLQGQGRLHAHRRLQPWACWARTASWARHPHRHRGGPGAQTRGQTTGPVVLLRRRRRQRGRVPRSPESGRDLEAARSSSFARTTTTRVNTLAVRTPWRPTRS